MLLFCLFPEKTDAFVVRKDTIEVGSEITHFEGEQSFKKNRLNTNELL
ncbi:MAG: hypothetical protein MUE30_18655 [Spirosomaceae bacterium]|nr:hypothetical protein [Spirosomataceae bacterium]